MGAEVKARITVDAENALKRIEDINKASGYASASMSKLAKEIGATNAALSSEIGKAGGTASGAAFKNITDQLEKQALAYTLVDSKSKAAAESASLYRKAIISLTKSGSLTKDQTDQLVRSYYNYKTEAESAKASTEGLANASGSASLKLLSVAKNILKFQLLMGPITGAIRGFKNTISDSIKVAAEAEQVFNKLSTVFDGLESSASRAASAISSQLGVATSTAAGALATVGDLLQAQGMGTSSSLSSASSWVSQFQDIIAFKDINMSLDEFAQTFMSGTAGNLRNFRQIGSIVKESAVNARLLAQGLDKLTGSELELAKMTARAEMALEQQANAMGATEREWETVLSVNRRLSEAWKEYKENLGDTINSVLKPMKVRWTEILNEINKVNAAQKQYNEGSLDISVYDIRGNTKDANRFSRSVSATLQSYNTGLAWAGKTIDGVEYDNAASVIQTTIKTLEAQMIMFGATVEDVRKVLGDKLPQDVYAALEAEERHTETARALSKEYDKVRTAVLDTAEAYDSFTESLALLPHLDMASSEYTATVEMADGNFMEEISEGWADGMQIAVRQAIRQMGNLGTDSFIDDIDKVFGTGDKATAYQSWLDEIKDLYTILYNRQLKFGDISDETLNTVIELWGKVNTELKDYNDELERQSKYASALAGISSAGSNYSLQMAQIGMTDVQKASDNLRRQYAEAASLAVTADEQRQIADAYEEAEQTLLAFYAAQERYNKQLEDEAKEKERLAKYADAVKSIQESTADYAAQTAQIGMTDNEKALDDLRISFEKMMADLDLTQEETAALDAEYETQREALVELQKKQKEYNDQLERQAVLASYRTGGSNDYATQLANFGKTSAQITREGLLSARNAALQGGDIELWTAIQNQITAFDNLQYETDRLATEQARLAEEERKEAARLAAWKATGNRALGSMGTMGQVMQSFQGEGDIWSKIINAVLAILENSERWNEISEMLDTAFAAFEPVIDAIIDMLAAIPWDIVIFCIKVIASVVVVIAKFVEQILNVFDWLWTNIKVAFHNLIETIKHPANKNARDTWDWYSWDDLQEKMNDTAEKEVEILLRIWQSSNEIVRNTAKGDDYAKQLSLLKSLYSGGALSLAEYSGAVAQVTGSPMGQIESYAGVSYARGGGGITYFSGDIVINGYNGDPKALALEIERILVRRQQAGGATFAAS